jgi:hypothetical protein
MEKEQPITANDLEALGNDLPKPKKIIVQTPMRELSLDEQIDVVNDSIKILDHQILHVVRTIQTLRVEEQQLRCQRSYAKRQRSDLEEDMNNPRV